VTVATEGLIMGLNTFVIRIWSPINTRIPVFSLF
jgi:hypothetical protein